VVESSRHSAPRAALVINPRALRNLRNPTEREALHRGFERVGEVVETSEPGDLLPLFTRWRNEGVGLIAISGGDGSFHAAVQAICAVWPTSALPRLVPLHGGTLGVVARAVGARPALEAVRRLRDDLTRGRPLVEVPLSSLAVGPRIGFNFGIGLFCTVSTRFIEGRSRGPAAVWGVATQAIASAMVGGGMAREGFQPWRGTVAVDGRQVDPATMYGLYASSVADMWKLRGFRNIPAGPDQFRHMRVQVGVAETVLRFPLFALGLPGAMRASDHGGLSRISLTHEGIFDYISDGELYTGDGSLEVGMGPTFRVVCPTGS
jgi:diacylglycerol kinase family enzyme